MTTAVSAQGTASNASTQAITAEAQATTALANAAVAYSAAIGSLQPSASTIVNSSNQMTAISTNGITVYSGSSPSSGARVVMNSAGIAGYNSGGSATFAINASTGAASFAGSITGSTITGSTLNIGGNFYVDGATGFLTCNAGATITGTITATSGSFTGSLYSSNGTIGNFNINSYGFTSTSSAVQLLASGLISTNGQVQANSINVNGASTVPSGGIGVYGGGWFGSTIYANSLGTTTSGLPVYQVQSGASAGYLKAYTSAQRFKTNITPISVTGYASIIDEMTPVTYDDIEDETQKDIPGLIAEELAKVKGMEGLVVYDQTGQTMGINYEKLGVMIILALKELNIQSRLTALEGKVNGFGTSS
jgi:hypothetical protein